VRVFFGLSTESGVKLFPFFLTSRISVALKARPAFGLFGPIGAATLFVDFQNHVVFARVGCTMVSPTRCHEQEPVPPEAQDVPCGLLGRLHHLGRRIVAVIAGTVNHF
jgi:hypothetical protein